MTRAIDAVRAAGDAVSASPQRKCTLGTVLVGSNVQVLVGQYCTGMPVLLQFITLYGYVRVPPSYSSEELPAAGLSLVVHARSHQEDLFRPYCNTTCQRQLRRYICCN